MLLVYLDWLDDDICGSPQHVTGNHGGSRYRAGYRVPPSSFNANLSGCVPGHQYDESVVYLIEVDDPNDIHFQLPEIDFRMIRKDLSGDIREL